MIRSTHRNVGIALAAACAALAPCRAQRVLEVPPLAPWIVRGWDTSSGLPQNTVSGVLQAHDGMLWVATYGGLCRFDGVLWDVFDAASSPDFSDSRITALVEDNDGALWFGSEMGIVTRYVDGAFVRVATLGNSR